MKVSFTHDTKDGFKLTILNGHETTCRERCTSYVLESVKQGEKKGENTVGLRYRLRQCNELQMALKGFLSLCAQSAPIVRAKST